MRSNYGSFTSFFSWENMNKELLLARKALLRINAVLEYLDKKNSGVHYCVSRTVYEQLLKMSSWPLECLHFKSHTLHRSPHMVL